MKWTSSELHELAEYIGRGRSPVYDDESRLPVLNQACIQQGRLDLGKLKFVSQTHFGNLDDQKKTRRGDIFVNSTGTGTLGRIAYWESDAAIAYDGHVTLVRMQPEYDPKYFYYLLQMPDIQTHILNNCISGSTNQIELSREPFRRIVLRHPEARQEQAAIAEILTAVDQAIEQTEVLIAKQRRIKAGLLHDLLTRGIDEHGNLRDPATHRFKESPVGLVPEEWEVSTVGALFTMELGKMLSGASKRGVCPKPYLANRNVQWGRVDVSVVDTMDFFPREQVRYRLQKDDILICEGGEVGRTALWNDELEECYFQKAIHRLRPIDKRVTPMFMLYYMQYVVPQGILLNLTTQTSIAHLTQEQLAVSPIVFAPRKEMDVITSVLQQQDDSRNKLEKDLEKIRRLKTGLMQDLLTGRVEVSKKFT